METNMGSKVVWWTFFGGEITAVAFELRWMIVLSGVLIFADLWWGHSESMKRYNEAVAINDRVGMEKYKWHKSRAIRRSANKAVEYLTYLLVGVFFGLAITEPMGGCNHVCTAAIGLLVGCLAEVASIIGHVCYVKFGVEVKIIDVWKWLLRFVINIFKVKNKEVGQAIDAIEDTIKEEKGGNNDADK